MIVPSRTGFNFERHGHLLAALAILVPLLNSCNDMGTSPLTPAVAYKQQAMTGTKNKPIAPDSLNSTGGAVDGYSVTPALPAGLTLDGKTGVVSGTPTVGKLAVNYTVTATGPNGSVKTSLTLCMSDSAAHVVCDSPLTSPFTPKFTYKRLGITTAKDSSIIPDTVITTWDLDSYLVSPALPAGLALDPATGRISGKAAAVDSPGTNHTVTASGPSGTATKVVNICIGHTLTSCNTAPPYINYVSTFVWTNPGVAITPDTANSGDGGIVSHYSISPSLPAGMTFDTATGLIKGVPGAIMTATEYKVIASGPYDPPDTVSVYIGVYGTSYPFALLEKGKARFQGVCSGCHNQDAKGTPGAVPPLYHSDFLMANRHRPIHIQMMGLPNPFDTATTIVVSGNAFVGAGMPAMGGNDSEIAGVLTFVRAMFNGAPDSISLQEVAHVRDSLIAACHNNLALGCDGAVDPTH